MLAGVTGRKAVMGYFWYTVEPPFKGHPSTKDIYAIKDTYQSPKYHAIAIFCS